MTSRELTNVATEVVAASGGRVVVQLSWDGGDSDGRQSLYQVVVMGDDGIVDMQDCRTRREAFRVAGIAA